MLGFQDTNPCDVLVQTQSLVNNVGVEAKNAVSLGVLNWDRELWSRRCNKFLSLGFLGLL